MSPRPPFVTTFPSPEWVALLGYCSFPPTLNNGNFDAAELVAIAESHGVTGLLATNLTHPSVTHPGSLESRLQSAKRAQVMATLPLIAEMFRVMDIFAAAEVETVIVKGPVLSVRAFGDSSARQYGDIDFLVRSADVARASEAMVAAGFQPRIQTETIQEQKPPGQYMFRRSVTGPLIEVHTERTLRYFPRPLSIEQFFQRRTAVSIDGRQVPALAAEDEFVLISVHGAKHFWERLMWIADIAAIVHHHAKFDWRRVRQSAAEAGAGRMVRVALLLAERLLLVPVPEAMKREVDADTGCAKMARKIESWLPYAGNEPPTLLQRALFRLRMRGQLFAGAGYLTRLSLSTTEEDWSSDSQSARGSLRDSLRRPFRLAKKYRRDTKESRED